MLARLSTASTASLEQGLLNRFHPLGNARATQTADSKPATAIDAKPQAAAALPDEGPMPSLAGAVEWLNSPPLTAEALRGHVVLVDFWTYSCVNCLRSIPYVRAWADKYRASGLVVIGVHAPEFAFEKDLANVRAAVAKLGITYPVPVDNNYAIWRAFNNQYWPAHYLIDAHGRIRGHHFGEGEYDETERQIQLLLAESGHADTTHNLVAVSGSGVEAAADMADVGSPETYIGYNRAANFALPGGEVEDETHRYLAQPDALQLNHWALSGDWTVGGEYAALDSKDGAIAYRFHARDLHLVLGPRADGHPIRYVVTLDGKPPGDSHGADTAADGSGIVTGQRLYQLVRQSGSIADRTFEIRFLDPGVQAYAFTFG